MVLDVKHVDKHLDSPENGLFLHQEVLLHECVLAPTVPQVESQRAHELELVLLLLHRISYLFSVLGREVGEYHRMH